MTMPTEPGPRSTPTTALVCGLLFLSGASALIFETLWFRQASLTFGNSVWATTLILCSFMGGLALGNALASRHGHRVTRPFRLYAALELVIALTGVGLVVLLPPLSSHLAPLFRPLLAQPWLLNPLRLIIALALMLAPATAMGATLPFLVNALTTHSGFGTVLGKLYGWNTLGAVAGALATEALLVGALGIRGAGFFAGALNLIAALAAAFLSRTQATPLLRIPATRLSGVARRILAAAFICGGTLLALEVVWFRFLLLFVANTSHALALLLAVILLGIGLGGLAGAALLRRGGAELRWAPLLAFAAGVMVVTSYAVLAWRPFSGVGGLTSHPATIALLGVPLMLPVASLSGMLFTVLGAAAYREIGSATRAAGLLTLANTMGSMLGALAGGFLLLPGVGMESSFFILALAYGLAAALVVRRPAEGSGRWVRRGLGAAGVVFALRLAFFPFGLMDGHFLSLPLSAYDRDGSHVAARREGLTETIVYLQKDWLGRPLHHRMVTNGFSMSGTHTFAKRYMKLFVYWPVAFHPAPRNALLISYGVGSTAKALTDTRSLEHIDVVDISRDVLAMGEVVFPKRAAQPLADPRVKVHVEDGRYFLLTTSERYDLITAEPPPPKNAGIVNLYTREYFALLRDRLAVGGIATYWLPVHDLLEQDAKTIIAAFCASFEDCSLWNGAGLDWMLVGSRGARPPTEEQLARQWQDPVVGPELRALGFEGPEQLGAMFLGDAAFLGDLTLGVEPLADNFPKRLADNATAAATAQAFSFHLTLMDALAARVRFEKSEWARGRWPPALRERTLPAFVVQRLMNDRLVADHLNRHYQTDFEQLHKLLTRTPYRTLPLWLMHSSVDVQRIAAEGLAERAKDPAIALELGIGAIAARDFAGALRHLDELPPAAATDARVARLRAYALGMAGRHSEARGLARQWANAGAAGDERFWAWLEKTFGLAP